MVITQEQIEEMSQMAWSIRDFAVAKTTKVGCALISDKGLFTGCNIEIKWKTGSIHAEVSAIDHMINQGGREIHAIIIVSNREKLTPCGGCLDWIHEYGDENTLVMIQNDKKNDIVSWKLKELMPFYPK